MGAASLLPELQAGADAEDEAAGLLKEKTSVAKAGPKSRAKSRAIIVSDDEVEVVAPPPGEYFFVLRLRPTLTSLVLQLPAPRSLRASRAKSLSRLPRLARSRLLRPARLSRAASA